MWGCRSDHSRSLLEVFTPSPRSLTALTAMRMALTWEADWRFRTRLVSTLKHDARSLVESYESIEFNMVFPPSMSKRKRDKFLAKAHAITLIWTVLSWCPGYGSHENPTFWKQIFDRPEYRTTDSIRFFRYGTFPHIRLHFESDASLALIQRVCSTFSGAGIGHSVRRKLDSIIQALAPFITPRKIPQVIEVTVALRRPRLDSYCSLMRDMDPMFDSRRSWQSLLTDVEFAITKVKLGQLDLRTDEDISLVNQLLANAPSQLFALNCDFGAVSPATRSNLLWMMTSPMSPTRKLTLKCTDMIDPVIGAIFSLFPLMRSLQNIQLHFVRSFAREPTNTNHLWYWLEYAFHHPHSAESSCEQLVLVDPPGTLQELVLLEKVARRSSTQRSQVLLAANTIIHSRPTRCSDMLLGLSKRTWLNRCFWLRTDGWICVIVPGFGIGWVDQSAHLVERFYPSSQSPLRALTWSHRRSNEEHTDKSPPILCLLAQAYGENLRYLYGSSTKLATADQVLAVLKAAPALKSLHMCHDGVIWSENQQLPYSFQSLEELSFRGLASDKLVPTHEVMESLFPNVTTLRLLNTVRYEPVAVVEIQELLRQNVRLQYVFFASDRRSNQRGAYAQQRTRVRRCFGFDDGVNEMAQIKLPLFCRLAVLAVVRHLEQRWAFSSVLGEDIMRHVFLFAAPGYLREVWQDLPST